MNNTGTLSVDITNGYGNKVIYVQYKVGNTYSDVYSTYIPVSLPQTDAILNAISLYSGSVPLAGEDIVMTVEYGATQDVVSGYIDFYSSTGLSINVAQNP